MAWFTGFGRGKGCKLKGASAPHSRLSQQQEELVRKHLCIEPFSRAAVETRFLQSSQEVVYLDKLDKDNREGAIKAFISFLNDLQTENDKFLLLKLSSSLKDFLHEIRNLFQQNWGYTL